VGNSASALGYLIRRYALPAAVEQLIGILLVTLLISGARSLSPYAATITFWNLALAFGMVLVIAVISGYIGVRKVLKIEPFDIFRG
jgi:putative ABC transport system permease protein